MDLKAKQKPLLLAVGILLAVLLIAGGFSLYRSFLPGEESPSSSSQQWEESSQPEEEPSSEESSSPAPGEIPQWDPAKTYEKGEQVLFEGVLYEAKWWTLGEQPGKGEGSPWQAEGGNSNSAPPPSSSSTPSSSIPPSSSVPSSSSSPSSSLPPNGSPSAGTKGFKVVAYYPSWKPNSMGKIQQDVVTHLIYAFAIPTKEGTLLPLENPAAAQTLIETAHQNGNKVLLGVGGWSYQGRTLQTVFEQATATDESLYRLGDAILAMCDQYGFDGVDMDWEHPSVSNGSSKRYEKLMLYLSEKLHAKGKLLTAAVLGGVSPDGATVYRDATLAHTDKVLSCVDWVNVMAYDGGDGERHSSYSLAVASAAYWKETRGLPANKVVLGMPFYGRPSWASYSAILAADPEAHDKDVTYVNGVEVHYNGMATIQDKTYYAQKHLGGVMVWEVTQDTADREKSLLTAIGEALAG